MIAKTIIRSILEIIGIDKIKKERKIKKACALLQDVGGVLSEIIRMLKPKSCLSPKMEELLMNMVKDNIHDEKEK